MQIGEDVVLGVDPVDGGEQLPPGWCQARFEPRPDVRPGQRAVADLVWGADLDLDAVPEMGDVLPRARYRPRRAWPVLVGRPRRLALLRRRPQARGWLRCLRRQLRGTRLLVADPGLGCRWRPGSCGRAPDVPHV